MGRLPIMMHPQLGRLGTLHSAIALGTFVLIMILLLRIIGARGPVATQACILGVGLMPVVALFTVVFMIVFMGLVTSVLTVVFVVLFIAALVVRWVLSIVGVLIMAMLTARWPGHSGLTPLLIPAARQLLQV